MDRGCTNGARGFTIMEILVSLVVIAVLVGLISVGVRGALRQSKSAKEQFTASGLQTATEQFRNDFGFLPPLVIDGEPLADADEGPVIEDPRRDGFLRIAVRDRAFLTGRDDAGQVDSSIVGFVNGQTGSGSSFSDKRYSKFSLAFYLMGECGARHPGNGEPIDGVQGAGMLTPLRDGRFDPRGRRHEPFYTPRSADDVVRQYADRVEYREHTGNDPGGIVGDAASAAIVGLSGVAFRYYRWENLEPASPDARLGEFLNIPKVLQSATTWGDPDATSEDQQARGGSYAIVGPGPDGVFGTEPVEVLESAVGRRLGDPNDADAVAKLRDEARRDNAVEIGR